MPEVDHSGGWGAYYFRTHPEHPIRHGLGEPCSYCDRNAMPRTKAGRALLNRHHHIDEGEASGAPNVTEHAHPGGDRYHHHENEPYILGLTALGRIYRPDDAMHESNHHGWGGPCRTCEPCPHHGEDCPNDRAALSAPASGADRSRLKFRLHRFARSTEEVREINAIVDRELNDG